MADTHWSMTIECQQPHQQEDTNMGATPTPSALTTMPPRRPAGTLEDALAAGDPGVLADWARYLDYENTISKSSLLALGRAVEEIGYVLSGRRFGETESVWNVASRIAVTLGHADLVAEVHASYEQQPQC
ncbi:hypothetical protein [Mycolicibacterium goodii]|uniref:hypothetical protein n=1 Tax=Mycolicibacterium goodii TaxID=134601 RepID=UPI00256F2221|nr:hypothetical protein [Mycolicibacterium goodii]